MVEKVNKKPGYSRGVESFRSLWQRMKRECNLYLSLKQQVERYESTSGKSDLQMEQIVSDLFSSRTGKVKKDWTRVPKKVFRYKEVYY